MAIKRIVPLLLAAGMTLSLLSGCQPQTQQSGGGDQTPFSFEGWESGEVDFPEGQGLAAMEQVASDGDLVLYFDKQSMDFAVEDRAGGKVWYSNPLCDPDFDGSAEDSSRALVGLTVNKDGKETGYDSFNNCVETGQFSVEQIDGGVNIRMAVGQNKVITASDLPQAVEKNRFETAILAQLDEEGKAVLEKRYTLYSVNDESISERKLTSALERFPILQERDLYILNNGVPDFAAQEVKGYLDSIGYDTEEIQKDNDDNGVDLLVEELLRYDLELRLTLEEGRLAVNLDCSRLAAETDVPVTSISLLKMFGASTAEEDEGWLLLPDGSGSIQNINGENSAYPSYSIRIYGEEKAIRKEQQYSATEPSVLPVFGQKLNDSGFVAMIEEGDAIASVTTNLKGSAPFSSVYPTVQVAEAAMIDAGFADAQASSNVPMVQPVTFTGNIRVEYAFLHGEDADLGGMSRAVRERYQELGLLPVEKAEDAEVPLNIELIGSVDKESSFLGIFPVRRQEAATTFEQAREIVQALHDEGIGPVNLLYLGWCNGGLYTKQLNKIKVEKALGGADGLAALQASLESAGDRLYPRVELVTVSNLDGFNTKKMAARALGNNLSTLYSYDVATGNHYDYRIGTYVAPAALGGYVSSFLKSYDTLGVNGLNVSDIGRDLFSDMNKEAGLNRQQSLELVGEALDSLSGKDLMVSVGNAYTWPSASYITDIPLDSSRYNREQYAVPFVQMVLHGYIGYGSSPVNNSADYREALLRAVAFGAHASFRWTYASSSFLNGTYFIDNLSTDYRDWLEVAAGYYARASADLRKIGTADMVGYRQLQKDVFETVYANGVTVIANYGDGPVTVDGETVGAQDWLCKGGETA